MQQFKLSNKRTYIIAEAGVNHNGSMELALNLVEGAAKAGANAIKFQTFKAGALATKTTKKAAYQKSTEDDNESQQDMLTKLELPEAWHRELQAYAHKCNIDFLSTAFDEKSLHFLQTLELPLYKIPSGELTNAPLLWHFAKTGKLLILSTGMACLSEVEQALAIIAYALRFNKKPHSIEDIWTFWGKHDVNDKLKEKVILLHCTSQYPTTWEEVNLKAMDTLSAAFGLPVGYSDHTVGTMISIAAVARGASIIEKHLTLDRSLQGPDHKASLDIEEFKNMVEDIRNLELALGNGIKTPQISEWTMRKLVRQSIIAARHIPSGKILEEADLTTARTGGGGVSPSLYWELIGSMTQKSYESGDILEF